jgi:hypothetical protein
MALQPVYDPSSSDVAFYWPDALTTDQTCLITPWVAFGAPPLTPTILDARVLGWLFVLVSSMPHAHSACNHRGISSVRKKYKHRKKYGHLYTL